MIYYYIQASLYQPIAKLIARLCVIIHIDHPELYQAIVEGSLVDDIIKKKDIFEVIIIITVIIIVVNVDTIGTDQSVIIKERCPHSECPH